jgi:hypothetical protein
MVAADPDQQLAPVLVDAAEQRPGRARQQQRPHDLAVDDHRPGVVQAHGRGAAEPLERIARMIAPLRRRTVREWPFSAAWISGRAARLPPCPRPRTTTPWRSTIRIEARVLRLVWSKIGSSTSAAASAWGSAAGPGVAAGRSGSTGELRRSTLVASGR